MTRLKIALVTTIPSDAIPAIAAAKAINEKFPNAVELHLRTAGTFEILVHWTILLIFQRPLT